MKEKPILFSAPMVCAILEDRKTQTRRLVKMPEGADDAALTRMQDGFKDGTRPIFGVDGEPNSFSVACPYGQPGDRLWVREEFYQFGHWAPVTEGRTKTKLGKQRWRFVADDPAVIFSAPPQFKTSIHQNGPSTKCWHKRLARFMPRATSRITLEVTAVKVERLQDISDADAVSEGVGTAIGRISTNFAGKWINEYRLLWESINGKGSWEANPWVWAYTFRRITQ